MSSRKILYIAFLVFVIPFIITRLPFFLHYPCVSIDPDYLHYYMIVDQINKGLFPTFIIRTPGYPIFLKMIFTFFNHNMAVVFMQNILSLFVGLFFIFIIFKVYTNRFKYLPLLAAIGMAAFISSSNHLIADTTLLTESLFVNSIILFFSLFILALHRKKNRLWVLCSFIMAAVILIRPTGIFLVLIFLIILVFLFVRGMPPPAGQSSGDLFFHRFLKVIKKKEVLSFSLPFIGILFLLSVYNYFTIGVFTFSGQYSQHALISFTATFLEKKETYKPQINKIIDESKKEIKRRHKAAVEESWNHWKLNRALRRYYNKNRDFIFESLLSLEKKDSYILYMKWRPLLSDMGWTAIKKNPVTYLKYVYTNLFFYFFHNMKDPDFYRELQKRYWTSLNRKSFYQEYLPNSISLRMYYKKDYVETLSDDFLKSFLKELWQPRTLSKFKIGNVEEKEVHIEPTFLQGVHKIYKKIYNVLFRNIIWTFIFLFALVFSFYKLVKSRFRHKGSLIMFTLTLAALLHGLIICMFSFAISRYSYTTEFAFYLSLFLLPIIFLPGSLTQSTRDTRSDHWSLNIDN